MRMKTTILVLLLVWFAVFGQDYAKGMLDVQKLSVLSNDVTAVAYPDANEVMLDDVIVTSYTPEGVSVTLDDTAMKILTEQGRRDNRVLTFHYNERYSKLTLLLLQVIDSDGKVTSHDIGKISSVMTDRSSMKSNIYDPSDKVLQVNVPDLKQGSIVRYFVRRETFKPRVPNTFSDFLVLEDTAPILRFSVEVHAPQSLPLDNIALLSPVEGTVEYSKAPAADGGTVHRWVARDVPQAFPEPKMPSFFSCVQRLLISTIDSWEDVSRWYWSLCEPHLKPSTEIAEKVQELCRGCEDDTARIRAIFKFVSQEIRYMGEITETEAPGYEPHPVAQTFSKRHGVCRDKAALLTAMLRTAGYQAYPVLIYVGPRKDKEVPQPYFNHAITAVFKDGEYILMDSTDENTAQLFPAYLGDRSYLVARPEGETLRLSPVPDEEANRMDITTHCDIDAEGDLNGYAKLVFNGINDNAYRGSFASKNGDEVRRFIQTILKRSIPGAKVSRLVLEPKNMMDTDTPLTMELSFQAPKVMASNGKLAFMGYPALGGEIGLVNYILGDASLDKRRFPFKSHYKCSTVEVLTANIAPNWGTPEILPTYDTIASDTMDWKRELSFRDDLLTMKTRVAMKTTQFSPEEYGQLKQNLRAIEANNRHLPLFDLSIDRAVAATSQESDIIVEEDDESYLVAESRSWTSTVHRKFQVMTYNGMKDFSELSIDFIPEYETVTIDYARVTNGADCTELNVRENKLMDCSWNASAPRYPKGRTLVANLPKVAVGSVVEYQYTIVTRGLAPFCETFAFQGMNPIVTKTICITTPPEMELSCKLDHNGTFMGPGDECVESLTLTKDGKVSTTWTAKNMPPLKHEDALPRLRFVAPNLQVSLETWTDYCDELWSILKDRSLASPGITAAVEPLSELDDLKKVEAIRNMVAKRIRRAGPNFTQLPPNALFAAEKTLLDGYGNQADCAILLHALLECAGLSPEFVLVLCNDMAPASATALLEHPDRTLFSNILVRVKAGGVVCWLNESDQYAELGTCAYEGRTAMDANGKTFAIAVDRNHRSGTDLYNTVRLFADGSCNYTREIFFFGNDFNANKKRFAEQTPEERRRYHLKCVNGISEGAERCGELVTDFQKYPGRVSFTAKIPSFASVQGQYLYVSADGPALPAARGDSRTLPMESVFRSAQRIETEFIRPDATYKPVFLPEAKTFLFPDGKSFVKMKCTSGATVNIAFETDIKPFLLPADNYQDYLETLRQLNHPGLYQVIYKVEP